MKATININEVIVPIEKIIKVYVAGDPIYEKPITIKSKVVGHKNYVLVELGCECKVRTNYMDKRDAYKYIEEIEYIIDEYYANKSK